MKYELPAMPNELKAHCQVKQDVLQFSREVKLNDQVVYAPLGSHYSAYLTMFMEMQIPNADTWDQISRLDITQKPDAKD